MDVGIAGDKIRAVDAGSTDLATFPGLRQVIDREVRTRIKRGEVTV
jgi:hypothetical protein